MENQTYDELAVGNEASLTRTLNAQDILLFAAMSGDVNPAHLDPAYAEKTPFQYVIGHGMWGGSLISTVLGTQLPGPGTIYLSQSLQFRKPVLVGDRITVRVKVREKQARARIALDCVCEDEDGEAVILGEALVIAPTQKVTAPDIVQPRAVLYEQGERLRALIEEAKGGQPLRVGVVHPVTATTLQGAMDAYEAGLIEPVLVGPQAKMSAAAKEIGFDLGKVETVDVAHSHAAAVEAVRLAREGSVEALMKGALHTDEIMGAVVDERYGLRTERRISHVYVMDTPAYERLLFITDAAINIAPDLDDKCDIVQNAIDLARAVGVDAPRVAILSAVETVYPKMQSTVDAAALCKMADRGQIKGGVLDGPLAFDNAISPDAVQAKGIVSDVAGRADILIVPDLEAGNMLAKQLDYLAGAVAAGVVLGARVPIILTSRAEGAFPRLASSAVACLYARNRHQGAAK